MDQLIQSIEDSELGLNISLSSDQILFLATKELIRLRAEVDELKGNEHSAKRPRIDYDSDSTQSTVSVKDEKIMMTTRDGGQHEVTYTGQNVSVGKESYQVVKVAKLSRLYSVRPGRMIIPLSGVQLKSLPKIEDA